MSLNLQHWSKLFLLFITLLMSISLYAQRNRPSKVLNLTQQKRYDKALDMLNLLLEDSEYMNAPLTYQVKGKLYYELYNDTLNIYTFSYDSVLIESYHAYLKALELMSLYEGDEQITTELFVELPLVKKSLTKIASKHYNHQNYDVAMDYWTRATKLDSIMLSQPTSSPYSPDTLLYYYIALTANITRQHHIALRFYYQLISINYGGEEIYLRAAHTHLLGNDTVSYEWILDKGRKTLLDKNNVLRKELIRYYLDKNQYTKSKELIRESLVYQPHNDTLCFLLANISAKTDSLDVAQTNYLQVIKINPNFFEAHFNLGTLYYNRAIDLWEDILYLPSRQLITFYDKEIEVLKLFRKAKPYLEKALQLRPADTQSIEMLCTIYSKLQEYDKYDHLITLLQQLDTPTDK